MKSLVSELGLKCETSWKELSCVLSKNVVARVPVRFYFFQYYPFSPCIASISHLLTIAVKCSCFSYNEIRLHCFLSKSNVSFTRICGERPRSRKCQHSHVVMMDWPCITCLLEMINRLIRYRSTRMKRAQPHVESAVVKLSTSLVLNDDTYEKARKT